MPRETGPNIEDMQGKEEKEGNTPEFHTSNKHMEEVAAKSHEALPKIMRDLAIGGMKEDVKEKIGDVKNKIKGLFQKDKKE